MTSLNLRGVIPAVPTPVSSKGTVDVGRLVEFCGHLLAEGADALNINGTTGEATSLARDQRLNVIAAVAGSDLDRSRVMFGTGAAAVSDAVALSRAVAEHGFAAALILPPFYFKDPSEAGLLGYFEAIIAGAPNLDIYLYNFPALSGVKFTREFVASLLQAFGDRIKGLKDSSGDLAYATEIATTFPQLKVFPSNEAILLEAKEGRFAGTISATANLSTSQCASAFLTGDKTALDRAIAVRQLIAKGPLVPRIKAVISNRLSDDVWANVLPPYVKLASDEASDLIQKMKGL